MQLPNCYHIKRLTIFLRTYRIRYENHSERIVVAGRLIERTFAEITLRSKQQIRRKRSNCLK